MLMLAACGSTGATEADGPRTIVFESEAVCADLTVRTRCTVVMCDVIPEGKTFEETCGPYFQEGFTDPTAGHGEIDRILTVMVPECAVAGEIEDRHLRISLPAGGWLSISGPSSWLESVRETTGTDCEA